MFRKLIAIVLALLINCAVLAWFHTWSATAVATTVPASTQVGKVLTLPRITVRPTHAQMDALRRERAPSGSAAIAPAGEGMQALVMPFYSFAGDPARAS
jgi:hypothetical protein